MKKDYLTLEQNLSSARIFLNLFGLYLESNNEKINEFSKIKILNSNNNQELYVNITIPESKLGFMSYRSGEKNIMMLHMRIFV